MACVTHDGSMDEIMGCFVAVKACLGYKCYFETL